MSNGDSLDGFVFPPFIPTASTRPAETPPAPPQVEPSSPPAAEAAGRMTMPWDLETPIVRSDEDAPAAPQAAEDEDLPWLEVPAPHEAEAPAAEAQPAQDEAFPEWLAWDERDGIAAEADARDTVAPIAGLEDFLPMGDLGGYVAPPPAAEWAEAAPEASASTTDAGFDAAPPPAFEATSAAEPFPEMVFDDAPAPQAAPGEDWSLAAPEAAEPPAFYDAPPPPFEASPAAAEASFEVSVDDGALSIEPAAAEPQHFAADEAPAFAPDAFVADDTPAFAPESFAADDTPAFAPEPFAGDAQPFAWDDEPVATSDRQPFVADEEAVLASEPEPFGADADAPIAAEPDPFTAAAVAEAEAVAPAAGAATSASPFDDVAARLEDIARMLRERPDELLAGGSSDPLALLVTGYVMGYTARGAR